MCNEFAMYEHVILKHKRDIQPHGTRIIKCAEMGKNCGGFRVQQFSLFMMLGTSQNTSFDESRIEYH